MLATARHLWKLGDSEGCLGLSCDEHGLRLGKTPLLEKRGSIFAPRAQSELERIFSRGFGFEVSLAHLMPGLAAVAAALNGHDLCRARIAAVQLCLPDLPDLFARFDMEIEDLMVRLDSSTKALAGGDWDPDKHPRAGTAPNPGWFAPTSGSDSIGPTLVADHTDDQRLHLPPGERNDEIGDLLEWIANAKPEDAQAISGEINRLFYQAGDFQDGNALHHALASVLSNPDSANRQQILDDYESITHHDPEKVGEFISDLGAGALFNLPGLRFLVPTAPAAETTEEAASEFWNLGWAARGKKIEEALGGNLPGNFPVIDRWADGIVTSIKSIDLNAATYQDAGRLSARISTYIEQVADFSGKTWTQIEIRSTDIISRELKIAVPKGSASAVQQDAINAAITRAGNRGVRLNIIPF